MATKELNIPFERREKTGSTSAHALRAAGKVPAVVYGHGAEPQHIALDAKAFDDVLHRGGRTGIVTLSENGKQADTALVRDIQLNPVSQKVLHVDLQRVGVHESVHAKLPIVTVGVSLGVKEFGGVMDVIAHELEIEGPADELPDRLEIDVTELGIHGHIEASDVKLPKGFKMLTPPDTTV
ncbi:MAG: 50S ribosomal protein L25, partial [Vulcanimicrobiaceae bacterium]